MAWAIGSHDIVTPKTMCKHNIISRNEKNRSKLVILQSFSALCYIFRKLEHFQITKFNRVYMYMAGGQALPSSNFFHTNPLRFGLPPNFIFQCYRHLKPGSSTYFFLLFPFLVLTKSQVLNLRVGKAFCNNGSHNHFSQNSKTTKQNVLSKCMYSIFIFTSLEVLAYSTGAVQCM